MFDRVGSPFMLNAQVTSLTAPGYKVFDSAALSNPYRTGMVIDSIRMLVYGDNNGGAQLSWFGGGITMRFMLGDFITSRDFVPIGAFGTTPQYTGYNSNDVSFDVTMGSAAGGLNSPTYAWFLWVPPRPIYIPPGQYLSAEVRNNFISAGFGAATVTVDVSYACRKLPGNFKGPKTIDVPYIGAFQMPSNAVPTGFSDSKELDLFNPFLDRTIHVQRLIARNYSSSPNSAEVIDSTTNTTDLVKLTDADGREMVKNPVPIWRLFNAATRSWNVSFDLPPKGLVKASFSSVASTYVPSLSLVGWREEPIR